MSGDIMVLNDSIVAGKTMEKLNMADSIVTAIAGHADTDMAHTEAADVAKTVAPDLAGLELSKLSAKSVDTHLGRTRSDHSPISIDMCMDLPSRKRILEYLAVRKEHGIILDIVKHSWEEPIIGCPRHVFGKKVIRLLRYI